LVGLIYRSESYQRALLPSRNGTDGGTANHPHKAVVLRELYQSLFPNGDEEQPERIRYKVAWLARKYTEEKEKLEPTEIGLLLSEMDESHQVSVVLFCCGFCRVLLTMSTLLSRMPLGRSWRKNAHGSSSGTK